MLDVAVRAGNRVKREVLGRVAPARELSARRYRRRLQRHRPHVPVLADGRADVLTALREEGVCVTTLDRLGLPGTAQLRAGLESLTADTARHAVPGADTSRPPLDDVLATPGVWQWGLERELLDLAEAHLGLPVRYYGADVRCEHATARPVGVRQWHRDVEDHRMFKILVWLNDVDLDGGPFEYVSRRHTERLTRELRYVTGFVSDDGMRRHVPEEEWRQATGPTWTAVVADTRSVFHRAMPPVRRDRCSVTFTYTSRTPMTTLPVPRVTERQRELASRGLDERQLACLPRAFTR
ncbi:MULTISPECIES: hypothetical protein [unclassified Geodermatophilus]